MPRLRGWNYVRPSCGTSGDVYKTSRDSHRILEAADGIEQGDVAGPALFAAGLKTPLNRLRAAVHRAVLTTQGLGISKFRKARSRLYRSKILYVNTN